MMARQSGRNTATARRMAVCRAFRPLLLLLMLLMLLMLLLLLLLLLLAPPYAMMSYRSGC